MQNRSQTVRSAFWLAALVATILSSSAVAAPAAGVEFALGNVTAQDADGNTRVLAKGGTVEQGDTVNTNEGRAQLRFTDGAFVSLHDETVFRIDEYRWEGVNDGSERSFLSLLKGGLRTITGQLSKINRKAYRMSTMVATIGIRGTEYTMQLNGDLAGSVAEGEVEVCNAGGCLAIAAGQSYLVPDAKTKPMFSDKQISLSPPQPAGNEKLLDDGTAGVNVAATGAANELITAGTRDITTTGLVNAVGSNAAGLIGFTHNQIELSPPPPPGNEKLLDDETAGIDGAAATGLFNHWRGERVDHGNRGNAGHDHRRGERFDHGNRGNEGHDHRRGERVDHDNRGNEGHDHRRGERVGSTAAGLIGFTQKMRQARFLEGPR